jgi:hypothetical protein
MFFFAELKSEAKSIIVYPDIKFFCKSTQAQNLTILYLVKQKNIPNHLLFHKSAYLLLNLGHCAQNPSSGFHNHHAWKNVTKRHDAQTP